MRLHEDVIRELTVKVDALEEGPSAMMQSKSTGRDRDGRDRDGPRGGRDRDDRPPRGDRDDRPPRGDRDDRLRPTRARTEPVASTEGDVA